ncbi:MAG: 30S ribosomal protein S18 [Chloroflexi bacterium]|nr:30S ribosomal protein S18 [Chloroflexota bacterium]
MENDVDVEETSEAPEERRSEARRSGGRSAAGQRRRRRLCPFCVENAKAIDYKDVVLLRQFISRSGRIVARRKSGTCAKHQRMVARAIKRARHIALLPFTASHTRSAR